MEFRLIRSTLKGWNTQIILTIMLIIAGMASVSAQSVNDFPKANEGNLPSYSRLAILHGVYVNGYGKNLHHDEYDNAVKKLNWASNKFASTKPDMDRLMSAFDRNEFDIAIVCPLFNFSKDVIDMTQYGQRFRKFITDGGALVISDAMYPDCLKWLTSIDPTLKIGCSPCKASSDIENTQPVDSIRFMPNIIRENNTWAHLVLPAGHGWDVIANCSQAQPQVIMKRLGKGFVYVCGPRFAGPEFLENFRANLELQRIGLTVTQFDLPQFNIGKGNVVISLKSLAARAQGRAVVDIAPVEAGKLGKSETFSKAISLPAGQTAEIAVPYTIGIRGPANVTLSIVGNDNTKAVLFDKTVLIPDLLTFFGPTYRGFAVESDLKKNNGRIFTDVKIAPDKEQLDRLVFEAVVKSQDGKTIGQPTKVRVSEKNFKLPIGIGIPAPGEYTIEGTLGTVDGKLLERKTAPLLVLTDKDCPVYINSDLNLVSNGQEFYPIGLYHVNPKELEQAAPLGFNTVQMFSWFGDEAFTGPAQYGIKVLFEQNHRLGGDDWVGENAVKFASQFPNVLLWYGMDEPSEPTYHQAKAVNDVYHRFDKGHPTFCVSCTPTLFPKQAALGDIFAVDPYPFPNAPISNVSDWMDKGLAAANGEKPVFFVTQSFGKETPEALRAMAYQGIIHEAGGIFWYPWDDGGTTGLKYYPQLHSTVKTIISEIKELVPALLNKTGREQFHSDNQLIHGLFCQDKTGKRYVLLVNPETTEQVIDLGKLPQLKDVRVLKNLFGNETVRTNAPLKLKPYQTWAFEVK